MTLKSDAPGSSRGLDPKTGAFYYHYAWVIVAIIAAMQMVGAAMRMAFVVLIDPLTQTFGWSQSEVTLAYAITSVVTALASPFAGRMGDRFGARKSMAIGSVLFLIGMVLTGIVRQPWHLYLTFGLLLGIAQAIFLVPLIPAAMTWFRRHLGVGMGAIMAAWGLGPALAAPIVGILIQELGWRDAVWAITAASGLVMSVMVLIFRNSPSDKGVLPYGFLPGDPIEDSKRVTDNDRVVEFTGYIRKTSAYWNMSSIHFLGCVGHAVILVYLVPLAIDEGISLVAAAGLLTVVSGVSVLTRVVTPVVSESLGTKPVMALWYFLQGITVLMLFWTHDLWMFYAFATVFGIGYGGESGGFPILNRQYYGHAPVGSAYGTQMLGAGLGMALGGWLGGPIYDITGSYDLALLISIVASLGGVVSIFMLEPTSRLIIPEWESHGISASDEITAPSDVAPTTGDG